MPLEVFLMAKIPAIVPVSDLRQGSYRGGAQGTEGRYRGRLHVETPAM